MASTSSDTTTTTCLQFESLTSLLSCLDTLHSKREQGGKKTLERVRLRYQGGWFGAEQVGPTLERRLFDELGYFDLVELGIYYSAYLLSTESLAVVLRQTRTTLKLLRLCSVILQGSIHPVRQALEGHPNLEQMELTRVALEGGATLEPLIGSLASCTQLDKLHLDALGTETVEAPDYTQAFSNLVRASPLKVLSLRRFPNLQPSTISVMFQALHSNTTMRQFSVVSFARRTRLEQSGVQAASDMLRINTTLEGLYISVGHTPLQPLVDALQVNRTLKSLRIYVGTREPVKPKVSQAFVDMLETNYTLEEIELYAVPWHDTIIQFLLKLNRAGRKRLLEGTTTTTTAKDWVDAIVSFSEDESVLFYLLSKNPSLCQLALAASRNNNISSNNSNNNKKVHKERPRKRARQEGARE